MAIGVGEWGPVRVTTVKTADQEYARTIGASVESLDDEGLKRLRAMMAAELGFGATSVVLDSMLNNVPDAVKPKIESSYS